MNHEEILALLKKLNQLSDWDNLPKPLLEEIRFQKYHCGVTVSLQYDGEKLMFVFNMSNAPDADDIYSLSVDKVKEIIK